MSEREPTYADRIRAELRVRCIHLRTKEAFVGIPAAHEQGFPLDDALWWCDQTGEALGPDGASACHADCHAPGRTCYVAPQRP